MGEAMVFPARTGADLHDLPPKPQRNAFAFTTLKKQDVFFVLLFQIIIY